MDQIDPQEGHGVSPVRLEKEWLEESLGNLKFVHPISRKILYGSGIMINEDTVLTLAQNVFDRTSSSFFTQLQFWAGEGDECLPYRVAETFLLDDYRTQKSEMQSKFYDYAILKLSTKAKAHNLCSKFTMNPKEDNKEKLIKLEEKCCNLEGALSNTLQHVEELIQKINKMRQDFLEIERSIFEQGVQYCANNSGEEGAAIGNFLHCLKIREKLYGKDSLQTMEIRHQICSRYSQHEDWDSSVEQYLRMTKIYQKHQKCDSQQYADAIFYLGVAYFRNSHYTKAIQYFKQALSKCEEFGFRNQSECVRFIKLAEEYLQRFGNR